MTPDYWLCGSVRGRVQKRDNGSSFLFLWEKAVPSSHSNANNFSFSLFATGAFQAATRVLKLRGSESE